MSTPKEARSPRGRQPRRKKLPKARRGLRLLVFTLLLGVCIWGGRQLTDMSKFGVTVYSFDEEKIEAPIRIAFLSDLHLWEFGPENADLVAAIRDLRPDIIAIGGDMINMEDPDISVALILCRQLVDIAPVYYAMGNHEYYVAQFVDIPLLSSLEDLGVHVLNNRMMTVEVNGNLIDIGGLSGSVEHFAKYSYKFWDKYDAAAEHYRLLLVHDPGHFRAGGSLVEKNIDLALCGHYHGGQVILPLLGPLFTSEGGFLPDLAMGCARVEDTLVVVSRGLGNHSSLPRINNPPELVVVDLR